jgi:hypothetical protein
MTDLTDNSTEEAGSVDVPAATSADAKEPPRAFLRRARRELNEEELSSPAARRFFIAEIERLDAEVEDLRAFRDRFHETNTRLAVLEAASLPSKWKELLSFVCQTLGAAGLGASPSYITLSTYGWVFCRLLCCAPGYRNSIADI